LLYKFWAGLPAILQPLKEAVKFSPKLAKTIKEQFLFAGD